MQPLFTVHAGEYLVGSYIEKNFKKYNVWVPSKDTGVDLLVTNSKNDKTISLQVKYSKDYTVTHMKSEFHNSFKAWGWWNLNRKKIKRSKADLWIFVMQSFAQKTIECMVLQPDTLLSILEKIHGPRKKIYQTYMWVRGDDRCWETRGLSKPEKRLLADNDCDNRDRDLSQYLNNWKLMKQKLK